MKSLKQLTHLYNKNCRLYHSCRWNNFKKNYNMYQLDSYLSLSLFSYMNNYYPTLSHTHLNNDYSENDLLSQISHMHIYNYYEEPIMNTSDNINTDEDNYLTEMSHRQSLN
jgi:hypothetical protein